jgi:ribosome-associated protein
MYFHESVKIDPKNIKWDFIRASGPGGQNVNKVATAVQLRYHIESASGLSDEIKDRLKTIAVNKINSRGELIIEARRFRTQLQNRFDAIQKLALLIQKAAEKPAIRKKTRPSHIAIQRRLENKKRKGEKKRLRQKLTHWV